MKKHDSQLSQLLSLEKMAREFGFDWSDVHMIIEQAISECAEIREAVEHKESRERIQEEIGDLLHTAVSMCLFMGFDIEDTLSKTNQKFGKRIKALQEITRKKSLKNLHGQSMDFMLTLWKEVKSHE